MKRGHRPEDRAFNPGVLGIAPYEPGRSVAEAVREGVQGEIVKMASNENALGVSPAGLEAITAGAPSVFHYPEVSTPRLRTALAGANDIDPGAVITGNGADGIIYYLGMTLLGERDEVIIPEITFPVYETISRAMRARIVRSRMHGPEIDLDDILAAIGSRTRMIWICNPNNPTGTMIDSDAFEAFLAAVPKDVCIVHDEVYRDFADTGVFPDTAARLREGCPNLFVIRSFSKIYGLAGLRLGYGFGPPDLISMMYRVRPPFDVSVPAEQAGIAALQDRDFYVRSVEMVTEGRAYLYSELDRMGLDYVRSHTNFVLIDTARDDRHVCRQLLERGVIVRPAASYGLPGYIRVTVGLAEHNQRLVSALEATLRDLR